MNSEISNKEN